MENYLNRETCVEDLRNVCFDLATYDSDLIRHCSRVGSLAAMIALELHFTQSEIDCLEIAGICHDYGKIKIPKSIIFKRGKLTSEERNIVEKHVTYGVDDLKFIFKPSLILTAIEEHHERLDGSGYPKSISDLSSYGRILGVCDVFDALVHSRRYKKAISTEEAFAILKEDTPDKFDERVVNALHEVIKTNRLRFYDSNLRTRIF